MKTEGKRYAGVLAEPLALRAPLPLGPQRAARIARMFGIRDDLVMSEWREVFLQDLDQILCRHHALYDHFEIDWKAREAARTLALSLAARHEPDILYQGARVDFGALCAHFETVDPEELVWKLAAKHVPAFAPAAREGWQGRLSSAELVKILFAAYAVKGHCKQDPKQATDRQVVAIMVDERQLSQVLPPAAAGAVQSILLRTGNDAKGWKRGLTSRERYLRSVLSKARTAWEDLRGGRADDLQLQLILEVLPMLHSLTADGAGQSDLGTGSRK